MIFRGVVVKDIEINREWFYRVTTPFSFLYLSKYVVNCGC